MREIFTLHELAKLICSNAFPLNQAFRFENLYLLNDSLDIASPLQEYAVFIKNDNNGIIEWINVDTLTVSIMTVEQIKKEINRLLMNEFSFQIPIPIFLENLS